MEVAGRETTINSAVSQSARTGGSALPPTSPYVRYVILLLAIVNLFNTMDRSVLPVLSPAIKADMNLSDNQLGLLLGFGFYVSYAICVVPIARWADRGIRRDIVALALTTWSLMTALCGAAQNFVHLALLRAGVGAAESGCGPSSYALICDYMPFERRAATFSIFSCGGAIGTMIGTALAAWLDGVIGWRWTFVAVGLPGIVVALIIRFTLREPARASVARSASGHALAFIPSLRLILRSRTYVLLGTSFILISFFASALGAWLPSFYTRTFGLSMSSAGIYVALMSLGPLIAGLAGGFLSNKLAERDARLPLFVGAAICAVQLPLFVAGFLAPTPFASLLLLAISNILGALTGGALIATMLSTAPPSLRATATSVLLFCTSLLGLGLGPTSIGILSEALAPSLGSASLRYALLAAVCLLPVIAWTMWLSTRTLIQDLKRLELESV